eukprot:5400948-Pleurochrysis_carterae.AAC.2
MHAPIQACTDPSKHARMHARSHALITACKHICMMNIITLALCSFVVFTAASVCLLVVRHLTGWAPSLVVSVALYGFMNEVAAIAAHTHAYSYKFTLQHESIMLALARTLAVRTNACRYTHELARHSRTHASSQACNCFYR